MPRLAVSLDLETTGLDPSRDAILEIGAVKFRGDEVVERLEALVDPGRPIPPQITDLTGITQEEVNRKAVSLNDVLPRLAVFAGNLPIVGHNIAFDLGFLNKQRVLTRNESIDTFELASILVPHAGRYGLGALARELAIDLPATHRALDDAKVTHALYMKLFERARDLPARTLEQILKLSASIEWPARGFFEDALRDAARGSFSGGSIGAQIAAKQVQPRRRKTKPEPSMFARAVKVKPLRPNPDIAPIDTGAIAAQLEQGGAFEQAIEHFEHRPQQVQMLRAVCEAFNTGEHLMVEAGTGTGKSLAYLLPAIEWALTNGERVVVSTNTINLQEQLATKDVPDLQKAIPIEFRAAVLKGRSHYLCPARLNPMLKNGPINTDEMRVLAKILLWLPNTVSGDGDELFLPTAAERAVWGRLSADNPTCTADRCAAWGDNGCFFHNARQEAEGAHVLIVNHSLLLADVAVANRALPEYKYLVVDEAHHLEAATTDQLSFSISRYELNRMLDELSPMQAGRGSGILGDVIGRVRASCPPELAGTVQAYAGAAIDAAEEAARYAEDFFELVSDFISQHVDRQNEYTQRLRLVPALRTQPAWSNVEIAWDNLSGLLHSIVDALDRLNAAMTDLAEYEIPDYEDVYARLIGARRALDEARGNTNAIVTQPSLKGIYWIEVQQVSGRGGGRSMVSLHSAPLHIGPLVEQHLFKAKKSVVLTSATLRTGKSFNFIQSRLNAQAVSTLAVGSPFDYKSSTLLYVATDVPEPNMPGYQKAIEAGLIELCAAMGGRTLVLFTSYAQLRATTKVLVPALARHDIMVFEQTDGSSRRQLLDRFKAAERGVLMGTRSFWEGVDVPGEALSCLAITRLPFAVPTDPIFAARSETFGDQAFGEYSVPDAVLRFRQGFGRLIRTKTDRGVVAVLDRRIISKQYGQMFLQSLPECTVQRGPTALLNKSVREWMNRVHD